MHHRTGSRGLRLPGRARLAVASVFFLAACEHTANAPAMHLPPNPHTIRLEIPDRAFRLTPEERASIRPGFDADALERLLAAVEPPVRPLILSRFQLPRPGEPVRVWVRMGDPALQPLLDEVWAPVYEMHPEMIDGETKEYPGRELARQRRDTRARKNP